MNIPCGRPFAFQPSLQELFMQPMSPDDTMARNYTSRYSVQDQVHLYPVEFVVRSFLGTYPDHHFNRKDFVGRRVLDLGCGDGRNFPLLSRLGFDAHGIEISEDIVRSTRSILDHHGLAPTLRVGTNADIPYPNGYFTFLLACHSCYYVEEGTSFVDNLTEMRRVLASNGVLIASLPMPGSHILKSALPLGDGHFRVTNDLYGTRNGIIMRSFRDQREITDTFLPYFTDLRIGFTDDEYWGVRQQTWIIVCQAH
jgi:SAM-dependent methyltransferase